MPSPPHVLVALLLAFPITALAHGGHGGGHGNGHAAGAFASGFPAHPVSGAGGMLLFRGGAFVSGEGDHSSPRPERPAVTGVSPTGGQFGGFLYVGPESVWSAAHWGSGFWAAGCDGWAWYAGPYWVSPAYPRWVWIGEPWVWDGAGWVSQDGYWTTADMPDGPPPAFVDVKE